MAPTVSGVGPTEGATDVAATTNVDATFSEAMDPNTISTTAFTLTKQGSTQPIAAAVSYDGPTKKATLDPNVDLEAGATYTTTVKGGATGVKDLAGNPLGADKTWSFGTAALTLPPPVDTTAPETAIDSGPSGMINSTSASFGFSSSEAGSTFECSLDGGPFEACVVLKEYANVSEGAHTFEVRATDAAGNTDATPASRSWTVDVTAPSLKVPSDPVVFEATGPTGAVVTYQVTAEDTVDPAPVIDCTPATGNVFPLGDTTVTCTATDEAGNKANGSFTVTVRDTTAPETAIDSGPSRTVNIASASFGFSSSEAGSTFECSLDGAAFGSCTSPKAYDNLSEGSHTFEVRATDAAGNTDATPASRTWTVDTVAPDTTMDSGPSGTIAVAEATFSFSSEAGATFECRLDGAAYSACTSPKSYTNLANGSHTFYVRAKDGAGNVDATPASRTFTVDVPPPPQDTTPPETTIDSGPSGTIKQNSATFAFSSTEAGSTFECKLDSAAFSACSSPKKYTGLVNGTHSFQVRATDPARNTDATPASRSWTVRR